MGPEPLTPVATALERSPATAAPSVAVVIPTYNHARFLAEAIESVERQTVRPTQIIVVDDGSTDRPEEVVARFPGVRMIHQRNKGLAGARNTGLAAASTDKILFLDADDHLPPEAISAGLACFERFPDAGFVYGAHQRVDARGAPLGPEKFEEIGADPFVSLLRGNCIGMHATVLYDRARLQACDGFDESLPRCEDYDVYLRLARKHPVGSHRAMVAYYRWHGENMSAHLPAMLRWVLKVQGAQREPAAAGPATRGAYRQGRTIWRDHYAGEALDGLRAAPDFGSKWRMATFALRASPRRAMKTMGYMTLRRLARRAPRPLLDAARRLAGRPGVRRPGSFRFGDFGAVTPACPDFGYSRGTPVDRYYIERFLDSRPGDIRGRALEIGDAAYCDRFGNVERQDVLHVDRDAPGATIVGDMAQPGVLPTAAFDCMVITQTLHLIYDMAAAVRRMHDALRPGGVALVTVPGITRIDRGEWGDTWFWSLTEASARRLFGDVFGPENCEVAAFGNVYAATCFLQGLALEEVDRGKLDVADPGFPVVVTIRARKASGS